jgi:hypothetical protein
VRPLEKNPPGKKKLGVYPYELWGERKKPLTYIKNKYYGKEK